MHEQGRVRGRLVESRVLRVEVDGVPVYWAEGDGHSPAEAGLLFRVGRADETLATAGISRLVATSAAGTAGSVDVGPVLTGMRWAGSAEEVIGFLTQASSRLSALSATDDVVALRRRLSSAPPRPTPAAIALGLRFGTRGPGLLRHVEYGLSWLNAAAAAEWRDRWFTAENAAAWIVAPALRGLELALRAGARQLVAVLPPTRLNPPAAAHGHFDAPTVAVLRPPSPPLAVALDAFRAAGATVDTSTLDRGVLHAVVMGAGRLDAVPDIERVDAPRPSATTLLDWCCGELLDRRVAPAVERIASRAAVTRQEITEEWRAALDTAVHLLPRGVTLADQRIGPAAVWSRPPLAGADHFPVIADPAHPAKRLVVEPTALTLVIDEQRAMRAPLAGATALRFADGSRGLWTAEGFYLDLRPADWEAGDEIVAAVDRAIPVARTVPLLSRTAPGP